MMHTSLINTSRIWAVIPTSHNKDTVCKIARECRQRLEHVLVVDDGSMGTDIEEMFSRMDISILSQKRNLGKGSAIRTALNYIRTEGAEFMLTIDADDQHRPEDIELFLPLLQKDCSAIIVGSRDHSSSHSSRKRRISRTFSNACLRLETGKSIDDSQSGFRAYPVQYLSRMKMYGRRYDYEAEVLTRAAWSGLELKEIRISSLYPPAGLRGNGFRPLLDNLCILLMHARLVGRRLLPAPYPILVRRPSFRSMPGLLPHPIKLLEILLKENATPMGLAVSAGIGMFLGVLPLVSIHVLATVYVASRLHLNKIMAVGMQNLCIPPFIPVACIQVGHYILHKRLLTDITLKSMIAETPKWLGEWLLGSLILAPVLGVIAAVAVFFVAQALQRRATTNATE